jgi:exodeoxyribonuclease-5
MSDRDEWGDLPSDLLDPDDFKIPKTCSATVPFSRYRGYSIEEVAQEDPSFLRWAERNTEFGCDHSEEILKALKKSSPGSDPNKIIPFGKFKGHSIMDIAEKNPSYLSWLASSEFGKDNKDAIQAAVIENSKAKIAEAPPMELTEHQLSCANHLLEAVKNGNHIVRLEGGAGYGKSFVTKYICTKLLDLGVVSKATAVSYVATQVLAEQLDPYGVGSATLARTLEFRVKREDGEEEYVHSDKTPQKAYELLGEGRALVVDEASMIKDLDAELLFNAVCEAGGLLVLVGDSHQLPPVKQETPSICCGPLRESTVAELKIPMRYAQDSHLFEIEQAVRADPFSATGGAYPTLLLPSEQLTLVKDLPHYLKKYVERYLDQPTKTHRIFAFKRKDVVDTNNHVRQMLFGAEAEIVEQDEQLMILRTSDTPYQGDGRGDFLPEFPSMRYYSGQTFRVVELSKENYAFNYSLDGTEYSLSIPHWRVKFTGLHDPVRIIFGINEFTMDKSKLGGPEYQQALTVAKLIGKKSDNWEPHKQLMHDFLTVGYTYATSVHRAQGQTVDFAYCNPRSLVSIPGLMGRALIYVAMTRARENLTLL